MNSFEPINHIQSFIDPVVAEYYYNQLVSILENHMYHLQLGNGKELKSRLVYHYDPSKPIEEVEVLKGLVKTNQEMDIIGIFINLFRPNSKDYLPYHTDKYDYQTVFTISLGDSNSGRNIRFREIGNTKVAKSYYQGPGDAHCFPLSLNRTVQHGIPTRNDKLSGRLSVVFFCGNNGYHLSEAENTLALSHINTGYLTLTIDQIEEFIRSGQIQISDDITNGISDDITDNIYDVRF